MLQGAPTQLPKGFIFVAFLNFTVGAVLGGVMAAFPQLTYHLAPIHAILNPYGWLTMMIYGMTFAVLGLSLGVRLPHVWTGWLQLGIAECGVILLAGGSVTDHLLISRVGVVALVMTPLLFLYNILSGVRFTKRQSGRLVPPSAGEQNKPGATLAAVNLFGRFEAYRKTDAVGQRGTDISLILFIIAAIWMAVGDWGGFPSVGLGSSEAMDWLVYYGWIGGTTISVALHLAPRFLHRRLQPAWWWSLLQVAWFLGLAFGVAGTWWGIVFTKAACGLVGFSLIGMAVPYVGVAVFLRSPNSRKEPAGTGNSAAPSSSPRNLRPLNGVGTIAWVLSWLFAIVLGCVLVLGVNPFTLSSIHLLFLGFITTLVYAVGYTAFPSVLNKKSPHFLLAGAQLACSTLGALLLVDSFARMESGRSASDALLATGGVLASLGVLMFLGLIALAPKAVKQLSE